MRPTYPQNEITLPTTLVAIIYAAHKTGDRALERRMKAALVNEHGMRVSFVRPRPSKAGQPAEATR